MRGAFRSLESKVQTLFRFSNAGRNPIINSLVTGRLANNLKREFINKMAKTMNGTNRLGYRIYYVPYSRRVWNSKNQFKQAI